MTIQIFDAFPDPVYFVDAASVLQYCNAAASRLQPDWTTGMQLPPALDFFPDENGVFSCCLNGESFQVSCIPAEGGTLLVLRPALRAPQCALRPELLASQLRWNTQQLSLAAHLLARQGGEEPDEKGRRNLAVVQQSIYRQLRLIRHLELVGEMEGKSSRERPMVPVDLAALCRETAYGAAGLAEQMGISLQTSLPSGGLCTTGDGALLEQMLLELISNALKAAGPGGRIGLKLASTGSRVLITIWDDGPGMEQSELALLMSRQAMERPPKPGQGLGLGLLTARYAASLHGGALLLESKPGQGLQATVALPIRRPGKGTLNAPSRESEDGYSHLLTGLADALPWQAFQDEI